MRCIRQEFGRWALMLSLRFRLRLTQRPPHYGLVTSRIPIMWKFFHKLASPPHFYRLAAVCIPWLGVAGLILIGYGSYAGLFVAPEDYQQGDAYHLRGHSIRFL